ncbi:unnamed protein product [Amoebophrya sp. A25]|nr:unnamed protein product [Amoebophrya sp. A25]|eukprot:GSA25T00024524001.1
MKAASPFVQVIAKSWWIGVLVGEHAWASSRLVKVIALARHGNRTPNAQVVEVCPKASEGILKEFRTEYAKQSAALSRVGMSECGQAGRFLRERYMQDETSSEGSSETKILPGGPFIDTERSFFFSERMDRNVVSLISLTQGLYPLGTGVDGFSAANPNYVPILTAEPFRDTTMNLPRDGPCKPRYSRDKKAYAKKLGRKLETEADSPERDMLTKFGAVCGFDFLKMRPSEGEQKEAGDEDKAVHKPTAWALKAAADMFNFANNEGINITDYFEAANQPVSLFEQVKSLSTDFTREERFGKPQQLVYWLGDFFARVLRPNLSAPEKSKRRETFSLPGVSLKSKFPWSLTPEEFFDHQKLLVFMNHREFLVALCTVLGIDWGAKKALAPGAMLVLELHEDEGDYFVKFLAWSPSKPAFADKAEYHKEKRPVSELFASGPAGDAHEVFPTACRGSIPGHWCRLEEVFAAYDELVNSVGTWQEVCHLDHREQRSSSFFGLFGTPSSTLASLPSVDEQERFNTLNLIAEDPSPLGGIYSGSYHGMYDNGDQLLKTSKDHTTYNNFAVTGNWVVLLLLAAVGAASIFSRLVDSACRVMTTLQARRDALAHYSLMNN